MRRTDFLYTCLNNKNVRCQTMQQQRRAATHLGSHSLLSLNIHLQLIKKSCRITSESFIYTRFLYAIFARRTT